MKEIKQLPEAKLAGLVQNTEVFPELIQVINSAVDFCLKHGGKKWIGRLMSSRGDQVQFAETSTRLDQAVQDISLTLQLDQHGLGDELKNAQEKDAVGDISYYILEPRPHARTHTHTHTPLPSTPTTQRKPPP